MSEDCCARPKLHYVKRQKSNGEFMLNQQCECGYIHKHQLSQKYIYMPDVPLADETKNIARRFERETSYRFYQELKNGVLPDERHEDYYHTPEWAEKRQQRLQIDNYICQACFKAKATQVHHLHYRTFGDEPMFDLVSVCQPCHQRIHRTLNLLKHGA